MTAPLINSLDTDLSLKIEDVIGGLRNCGYRVTCQAVPGQEREYYEQLREAMANVDATIDHLHKHARCRGRSKRTLRLLHKWLPEPGWGISV
ncbi:MAG: hypothetical protein QNJ62_06675 [Methyloceanibacter sp.]|nr:hypothetical protein [Methyloceanibacter sp.]